MDEAITLAAYDRGKDECNEGDEYDSIKSYTCRTKGDESWDVSISPTGKKTVVTCSARR